jgi:galactokinase
MVVRARVARPADAARRAEAAPPALQPRTDRPPRPRSRAELGANAVPPQRRHVQSFGPSSSNSHETVRSLYSHGVQSLDVISSRGIAAIDGSRTTLKRLGGDPFPVSTEIALAEQILSTFLAPIETLIERWRS